MKGETQLNKDIYDFANYYFNLYRSPKTTNQQVEEGFAEKCFSLGFEMDCGNSFEEKYPNALKNNEELDKIIDSVDDAHLLGDAIFSQWRYVTHWSYGSHLLDPEFRSWFITAFGRLVSITAEDNIPPFVFFGNVKKVKIHSNIMSFGFLPKTGTEIEQHLTITEDGRIWLTRYAVNEDLNFTDIKKTEQKQFKISKDKAKFLLGKFTEYFRDEYDIDYVMDASQFEMWIDDDEGKKAYIIGPMSSEIVVDGCDLSQLVRDTLNDQTLFVFDGNKYEKIQRITIDYKYTNAIISDYSNTDIIWEYKDHLVIDREAETIEDVLQFAEQCDVTRKYHIAEGVHAFLDKLDSDFLFTNFNEPDDDLLPSSEGTALYEVKVDFQRQKSRIISGTYDKQGLPTDWPKFIEDLYDFISFYGLGEIFDENCYAKTYRRKNDYIFLSVVFGDYGKSYYYLTDDDTVRVGDQVEVPVGNDGTERIVTVTKKEYFSEDKLPMPLEKVKSIIGKFIPPQENENGEKFIYCPMCEKEIDADICYDIVCDPLTSEVANVISAEEIEEKQDICKRCKYHDE